MKNIVIYGIGGMGRDVQWLIERINEQKMTWNILGYIDDNVTPGTIIDDYPVLGGSDYILQYQEPLAVVVAIGHSATRKKVVEKISCNTNIEFPNLIDPSVICSKRITYGKGIVICAACVVSVDITIGDFVIICPDCTIGHDDVLCDYAMLYPSVNVSGCVTIQNEAEIGTGSNIIQGLTIGEHTIVGAGAVVIHDMPSNCVCAGCPAVVKRGIV